MGWSAEVGPLRKGVYTLHAAEPPASAVVDVNGQQLRNVDVLVEAAELEKKKEADAKQREERNLLGRLARLRDGLAKDTAALQAGKPGGKQGAGRGGGARAGGAIAMRILAKRQEIAAAEEQLAALRPKATLRQPEVDVEMDAGPKTPLAEGSGAVGGSVDLRQLAEAYAESAATRVEERLRAWEEERRSQQPPPAPEQPHGVQDAVSALMAGVKDLAREVGAMRLQQQEAHAALERQVTGEVAGLRQEVEGEVAAQAQRQRQTDEEVAAVARGNADLQQQVEEAGRATRKCTDGVDKIHANLAAAGAMMGAEVRALREGGSTMYAKLSERID